MNILIVDDDRFVITALKKNIDWENLGITGVFTAGNIYQAQELFHSHEIDILLSDIEMPGGSGLELLSWLRQEHCEVQAIFLTNYANFNYAQKAIALQSFEYYLKPIEFDKLSLIIQKAVHKVHEVKEVSQIRKAGKLWNQHESQRCISFWQDYFKLLQLKECFDLQPLLAQHHIAYSGSDLFLCCIADLFPCRLSKQLELDTLRDQLPDLTERFCLTVSDACRDHQFYLETVTAHPSCRERFYLVFRFPKEDQATPKQFHGILEQIRTDFYNSSACNLILRYGALRSFSGLVSAIWELSEKSDQLLFSYNRVLCLSDLKSVSDSKPALNMTALECHLQSGNPEGFLDTVSQYVRRCIRNDCMSAAVAAQLRLDVTQLVFSYLSQNEILAHNLFDNKTYAALSENAQRSIPDLENFLHYIGCTALNYVHFSASKASVVETIRQYIEKNYADDISRSDFADIVYLNPDHIARIFRKETGVSLGSYIIQKRIEVAKNLLENTGFPINSVADKVGYGNYSYFTKLFKKETGFTPNEYRQNARARQDD